MLFLLFVVLTSSHSEHTPEGIRTEQLEQILLNGNNVCIVS